MKKSLLYFLIIIFLSSGACLFTGCTDRMADLTIVSTKNVELGAKYKKLKKSEGIDKNIYVLFIPIGMPNMEEAVDNCIENGKGVLLTDAVIKRTFWWALLYGENYYTVTGDVWVKADLGDLNNPDIELFELRAESSGLELVSLLVPDNVVKVSHYFEN